MSKEISRRQFLEIGTAASTTLLLLKGRAGARTATDSLPSRTLGRTLGVQQRLMRRADIKTTMNTYGSAFEKTKRRANSRVADLVLPPAIKRQLQERAKEVSLKNLRPETAAIQ